MQSKTKRTAIDLLVVLVSFAIGDFVAAGFQWISGTYFEVVAFAAAVLVWGLYYIFLRSEV